MKRVLMILAAVGVLVVGGGALWFFNTGDTEPSTELTAPPVSTTAAAATDEAPSDTTLADESATEDPATDDPATDDGGDTVYAISSDLSLASFALDEELRGQPTRVVGTTNQVAGEILVNFDDPSQSVLGDVVINARTLETDSSNRNRAVRGPILDTDAFEFITFSPTSIDGLPTEAGDAFSFTVTGDLTIRDVTTSVTFDIDIESTADGVEGTATAIVLRGDYGLTIPSVPSVANVSDEVTLTLEFVALP